MSQPTIAHLTIPEILLLVDMDSGMWPESSDSPGGRWVEKVRSEFLDIENLPDHVSDIADGEWHSSVDEALDSVAHSASDHGMVAIWLDLGMSGEYIEDAIDLDSIAGLTGSALVRVHLGTRAAEIFEALAHAVLDGRIALPEGV